MTHLHVRKKVSAVITLLVLAGATTLFFQNCSSEHSSSSLSGTGGVNSNIQFGSCTLTGYEELFSLTYAPFLQAKCASCHDTGGQAGERAFASSNIPLAFDAFTSFGGFQRISEYATNPAHKPPFSGTQNIDAINEITQLWQKGVEEITTCKNTKVTEFVDDPWADVRIPYVSKPINPATASGGEVTVRWNMESDHLAPPAGVTLPGSMPGAFFELTVRTVINGSTTHYRFYRPRIVYPNAPVAGATDLHIQSIRIKLNGEPVINETTFHFLDAYARQNQNTFLSAGAMVSVGDIRKSDVISISFGKIEAVTMAPPPAAPSAQFAATAITVAEGSTVVKIPVQLSQPIDGFTTVSYAITGTAQGPARYQPTGVPNAIPRWDSDYSMQFTGGSLVFEPGTTTGELTFTIEKDDRFEGNETIIVTLTGIAISFGTANLGTNTTYTITITDDDSKPSATQTTLSQLMSTGGPFEKYCIRCHYPKENGEPANNYSMVTYTDLLSRNRFVPNSPSTSTSWQRINSSDLLKRMPSDIALSTSDEPAYNAIYNWIINGAKNN